MNHIQDIEYTNRCNGCGLLWSLVGPPGFKEGSRAEKMFKYCEPRDWKPDRAVVENRVESLRRMMKDAQLDKE